MSSIKWNKLLCISFALILSRASTHAAQAVGGVTLTEVVPRVVTPNGDLLNDVIFFKFDDSISGLPIEGDVFDINGAEVANLTLNSNETALLWDGKDDTGRFVQAGIYIYSIKLGNRQATGTVVVAR
jgi:flagellar hook assembly protein FlgD